MRATWEFCTIPATFPVSLKLVQHKKVFLKQYIKRDINLAYIINVLLKMYVSKEDSRYSLEV